MNREEFEDTLMEVDEGEPHFSKGKTSAAAEAKLLAHDAEQRAEIERLQARLNESEKAAYDVAGIIEYLKSQLATAKGELVIWSRQQDGDGYKDAVLFHPVQQKEQL